MYLGAAILHSAQRTGRTAYGGQRPGMFRHFQGFQRLPSREGKIPSLAGNHPSARKEFEALARIFDIVADINASETDAIGQDLGIIGAGKTPLALQSVLKAAIAGNKVELDWRWQGNGAYLDQCEIQVDCGTGYQILTFDSTPGYTDTTPHPATLTRWKYRAIYRMNDTQVGLWSAEVSVTVG